MKVANLSYQTQTKKLFSNLSFDSARDHLIVIEGKNGSGKSTLLKLCLGLEKPSTGTVTLEQRVGYVPDSSELYFVGMSPSVFFHFLQMNLQLEKNSFYQKLEQLKGDFSFHDRLMTSPIQSLSLGEKKKVMLMAAFLLDPPLYLMDEPFSGLDKDSLSILSGMIAEGLAAGKEFIIVTHGYQDYLPQSGRVISL